MSFCVECMFFPVKVGLKQRKLDSDVASSVAELHLPIGKATTGHVVATTSQQQG